MKELDVFNAKVRQWAGRQPAKYRLTALAFGYLCNRKTHSFSQTLDWVSKRSRKRPGEGVSRRKLAEDLRVFEASGVITVERRRSGSFNMSSVYHVDFDKVIDPEAEDMGKRQRRRNRNDDAEREAFYASLDVEPPPEDIEPAEHAGWDMDACPACVPLASEDEWDARLKRHVDGGGQDPWDVWMDAAEKRRIESLPDQELCTLI